MKRYRTYQVLKWFFAFFGVTSLIAGMVFESYHVLQSSNYYLASGAYGILAIFFKLQEDSNKPTI